MCPFYRVKIKYVLHYSTFVVFNIEGIKTYHREVFYYEKVYQFFLVIFLVMYITVPIFSTDTTSYTIERTISPNFSHIWSISAGLSINSAGKARCSGSVDASSISYTSELTVSLQKNSSRGWTTIKSWTDSGPGHGLIVENYYYVDYGTYRVCSTAKIFDTSGKLLETQSLYSAEETY